MQEDRPERHQFVSVLVSGKERHFKLTRYTTGESIKHLGIQEKAWNAALKECGQAIGDPLSHTLSSTAYLKAIAPRVVALLQNPADFDGPLTEEEFWKLDPGDASKVMAAQEELSSMEDLIANGEMFLELARERSAKELLEKQNRERT